MAKQTFSRIGNPTGVGRKPKLVREPNWNMGGDVSGKRREGDAFSDILQPEFYTSAQLEGMKSANASNEPSGSARPADSARKLTWLDYVLAATNIALVIVGIWALSVYRDQLNAMQGQLSQMAGASAQTDKLIKATQDLAGAAAKQATVMRQQLMASYSAVVYYQIDFTNEGDVTMLMQNISHGTANRATMRLVATVREIPSQRVIGETIKCGLYPQPLRAFSNENSNMGDVARETCHVKSGTEVRGAAMRLEKTLRVEWDASYDNGFGITVTKPRICKSLLLTHFNFNKSSGNIEPQGLALVDCATFDQQLKNSMESKRVAEAEQQTAESNKQR